MAFVFSSNGDFEIDHDGRVVEFHPWPDASPDYFNFVRFDLEEHRRHHGRTSDDDFDILDLGVWTSTGEYIPPDEEWRKLMLKKDQRFSFSQEEAGRQNIWTGNDGLPTSKQPTRKADQDGWVKAKC